MNHHDMTMQRLINQQIAGKNDTAEAVVKWMGAMQAQDYYQSLWAIGVRVNSVTLADIERAIAEAKIVRTWTQRGTIHFVSAEDTKWMLKLCASRILAGHGRRMAQLALTDDIIARCEKLIINAMIGGKIVTRADIFALFENAGISTDGQRGYHILWHLAHLGVICMAPMKGKEQTFVLLEEWVKNLRDLSHDEALTELVYRYFASHGPATDHDFARWSGLTLTDTRIGIKNNDTRLQSVKIGDTTYWMGATPLQADVRQVYLLPGYDEYFIGYQNRQAIITDEHAQKVVPGNNGVFQPMIVVDGQVVGTWKHKIKRNALEMNFYPFTTIDHVADSMQVEVKSFAHFMGADFHP